MDCSQTMQPAEIKFSPFEINIRSLQKLFDLTDYLGCLSVAQKLIESSKDTRVVARAYYLTSISLLNLHRNLADIEEAEIAFKQALKLDPQTFTHCSNYIRIKINRLKKVFDSIARIEKEIAQMPADNSANIALKFARLAKIYADGAHDFEKAIEFAKKALTHDSNCALAHCILGITYLKKEPGNQEERILFYKLAEEHINHAHKINPNFLAVRTEFLNELAMHKQVYLKAQHCLNKAFLTHKKLKKDSPKKIKDALANIYSELSLIYAVPLNSPRASAIYAFKAIECTIDPYLEHAILGKNRFLTFDLQGALEATMQAAKFKNIIVLNYFSQILILLGKYEEAERNILFTKSLPNQEVFESEITNILDQHNFIKQSEIQIHEAQTRLQLNPNDMIAALLLAKGQMNFGDPFVGIKTLEKVDFNSLNVSAKKIYLYVKAKYAQELFGIGDLEEATQILESIKKLAQDPKMLPQLVHELCGKIKLQSGNDQEAIMDFVKAGEVIYFNKLHEKKEGDGSMRSQLSMRPEKNVAVAAAAQDMSNEEKKPEHDPVKKKKRRRKKSVPQDSGFKIAFFAQPNLADENSALARELKKCHDAREEEQKRLNESMDHREKERAKLNADYIKRIEEQKKLNLEQDLLKEKIAELSQRLRRQEAERAKLNATSDSRIARQKKANAELDNINAQRTELNKLFDDLKAERDKLNHAFDLRVAEQKRLKLEQQALNVNFDQLLQESEHKESLLQEVQEEKVAPVYQPLRIAITLIMQQLGICYVVGSGVDALDGLCDLSDIDIVTKLSTSQIEVVLTQLVNRLDNKITFRKCRFDENLIQALFHAGPLTIKIDIRSCPNLNPDNLAENARLRDFTMNAIFRDKDGKKYYPIINSEADSRKNIIRTIKPAIESFEEDPTRIFRALGDNVWKDSKLANDREYDIPFAIRQYIIKDPWFEKLGAKKIATLLQKYCFREKNGIQKHGSARYIFILIKFNLLDCIFPNFFVRTCVDANELIKSFERLDNQGGIMDFNNIYAVLIANAYFVCMHCYNLNINTFSREAVENYTRELNMDCNNDYVFSLAINQLIALENYYNANLEQNPVRIAK